MTRSSPARSSPARASPARRSQILSSPDRGFLSRFLGEDRNTEYSHRDALAAAQAQHERVRESALRVFQLHELQEEHNRIIEQERQEQERLKREAAIAAEEQRLRELRAKSIPKPPPEPEPPKAPEPPKQAAPVKQEEPAKPQDSTPKPVPASQPTQPASHTPTQQPPSQSPFAAATQKQNEPQKSPFAQVNGAQPKPTPPVAQPAAAPKQPVAAQQPPTSQAAARYSEIHQNLKKLRKEVMAQSKVAGSPMKGKVGSFRREIRMSIGQLTAGRGANNEQITKITAILRESLSGQVPSPLIDPSLYVMDTDRQPAEGATNNGPELPALFIYLLNICAKGIISQFVNEGGANPKSADPVGIFTAHLFSSQEFQWRGQTLIDILIAKFRMSCPVLFGLRGNDRTEKGRRALGWKEEGPGAWISEQAHNDRMTGLGAGFAALSLRDFSKTSKTSPYPPSNYWRALAGILNTPAGQTSNTQYVVLRYMIEGHEQRFINFYGNAALAALRMALIEFPKKAPTTATAAGSLQALIEVFKGEGLLLS